MVLIQSLPLPIGEFEAPNFRLPATDGKTYSLIDFSDSKGFVVVFTCNHCPYAQAAWPLLISIYQEYSPKGISFAAINPNDEITYPEDSFAEMKRRVVEWKIPFPYLRDGYQETAKQYRAQCTPDIYVFDSKRKLYYHGRINDRWQDQSKVTKHDLKEALSGLLAGNPAPKVQIPSIGCSIK